MGKQGSHKLSLIQVSRIMGISIVVISHINNLFYDKFGYDWFNMATWERSGGVDFFFVVTGFMIYYIYHTHLGVPGKTKEFLLKRFIKIYPLYWIFTVILLTTSFLFPNLHEGYTWTDIIKSILLLPGNHIVSSAWSLSHIVFFYLLFSCLIFKPSIAKPIIACWIVTTILVKLPVFSQWNSFLFSSSSLEIITGSFVAYVTLRFNIGYSSLLITLGALGYLAVWTNNIYSFFPIYAPVFFCLFSMMIVLGIGIKDKRGIKIPKILSFLGDASYSIYISHGPFLIFYVIILREFTVIESIGYFWSMLLIFLLTVLSSSIVYVFIEKPLTSFLKVLLFSRRKEQIEKSEQIRTRRSAV